MPRHLPRHLPCHLARHHPVAQAAPGSLHGMLLGLGAYSLALVAAGITAGTLLLG